MVKLINHFKPLLDAFQGSFKDKYHYWIGIHIGLRSIFYTLYALQQSLRLIIGVVILILFACFFGYTQPYKKKAVNFQELLLLANLAILHAVSYHSNRSIFSVITNLMIF